MNAMKELLPGSANGELAAVCSWLDLPEIRKGYPWSIELHYAYTPDFQCTFGYSRDCHNAANETDRCVVGANYIYTMRLELAYKYHKAMNLGVGRCNHRHSLGKILWFKFDKPDRSYKE